MSCRLDEKSKSNQNEAECAQHSDHPAPRGRDLAVRRESNRLSQGKIVVVGLGVIMKFAGSYEQKGPAPQASAGQVGGEAFDKDWRPVLTFFALRHLFLLFLHHFVAVTHHLHHFGAHFGIVHHGHHARHLHSGHIALHLAALLLLRALRSVGLMIDLRLRYGR